MGGMIRKSSMQSLNFSIHQSRIPGVFFLKLPGALPDVKDVMLLTSGRREEGYIRLFNTRHFV